MHIRRATKAVGIAAATVGLVLATAACNDDGTKGASDTKNDTKGDPKATVAKSLKEMENTTYTADLSMGDMGEGSFEVDLPKKAQHGTIKMDGETAGIPKGTDVEVISIRDDAWAKTAVKGAPEGWMHFSAKDATADIKSMDMGQLTKQMMDSLKDVKSTGDNSYTAKIDLKEVAKTFGGGSDAAKIKPFDVTFTLNDKDLLKSMDFTIPKSVTKDKKIPMSMDITKYGADVDIAAPPADEVTEMDDLGKN